MIIEQTTAKGAICAEILATLPEWFGLPASNAAYARDVGAMPMLVAQEGGKAVGFLALNRHTPHAAEIHVMGVRPEFHLQGLGRALVAAAEAWCRARGIAFFTVKTRSPSAPDPNYAKTIGFYESMGFVPIEEFPTLWDPQNPALMMAKYLG